MNRETLLPPQRSSESRLSGGSVAGTTEQTALATPNQPGATAVLPPVRILLVSDLFLHRAGLRRLLEGAGNRVVAEAARSDEAVTLAVRECPDIIIVDIDLRDDAFACLRSILTCALHSRIIALSDRARAGDHLALIELGATGLVLKCEPPDVLIKAIEKVNAGEVWLPRSTTAQVLGRFAQRRLVADIEGAKIAALSRREREIVPLVCDGLKNPGIANRLFVSEATVRNHMTSILAKLGVSDRFELAVYAFRHGMARNQQVQKV